MKQLYKRCLQALITYLIIVVSLYYIVNSGWIKPIAIGAIIYLLFAYIVNSFKEILVNKVILSTYVDRMESLRQQMIVTVPCSFCSRQNAVPFRMDGRNEFECEHCKKPNLLVITANTAQITTPIAGPLGKSEPQV